MNCFYDNTGETKDGRHVYKCAKGCTLALINNKAKAFAPCLDPPPAGVGDSVASLLAVVGIRKRKNCNCAKRQAMLNKLLPYGLDVWRQRMKQLFQGEPK